MNRGMVNLGFGTLMSVWAVSVTAVPQINLGNIPAGKKVTISYDVTINNNTTGNEVSSQATVSGANFADVLSDDPDTATLNDATVTSIDAADTSLTLKASDATPQALENVTFTATVVTDDTALSTPQGDVEFRVDGGAATIVTLNASGQATFDRAFSVGNFNVTASYLGEDESKPSANSVSVSVAAGASTTTINSVTPDSLYVDDTATVSFSVNSASGITPVGTVNVSDGQDSCSATVAAGSCNIQFSTAGDKNLVATFNSGNGDLSNSSSSPVMVEVLEDGAPLLEDDTVTVNEDEAITFKPLANDQSDNGFDLTTLSIVMAPDSGVIEMNRMTGEMTYRGIKNFNGTDKVRYQIMDIAGLESNTATINITVTAVNDAPVIESEAETAIVENNNYQYEIIATDVEGQALQVSAPTLPGWLQLVGDQLVGTPQNSDIGQHNVGLEVSDGAKSTSQTFTIQVVSTSSNDIALSQATSDIAPLVGEEFEITYSVTNSGPTTASSIELMAELDGDALLMTEDGRCQINLLQLSCQLGGLDSGGTTDIGLMVTGNSLGDIYSYVQLTVADDELASDNQSGLGISVTNDTMADKAFTIGEAESNLVLSGDVNNDGQHDIVLLQGFNSIGSVFINGGYYSFEKISDILGYETATDAELADINNDGYLDLIIATAADEYTLLYLGDGNGVFKIWQTLSVADSQEVAVADLNADGYLDVVVANKYDDEVFLNQDGVLQLSHKLNHGETTGLALADADGDNLPDALFAIKSGDGRYYNNAELLNSAAPGSSFTPVETETVQSITSTDINQDDRYEFIAAVGINQTDPAVKPQNKLYQWNNGLNLIQSIGGVDSAQIIAADIDGDDDQDLFIRNQTGAHQLYFNQAGLFEVTDKLLINPDANSAAWLIDESDKADLLLAESLEEASALYANQGGGDFGRAETDLELSYSANASSLTVDGVVEAKLIVSNNGPGSAQGVELSVVISSGLNVIQFGSGTETCDVTERSVNCQLGSLAVGDRVTIPVRLLAINTGEATVSAQVSAPLDELTPGDNKKEVTIEVTPKRKVGGGSITWLLILLLALSGWRRKLG